jgi:hypothetical protein
MSWLKLSLRSSFGDLEMWDGDQTEVFAFSELHHIGLPSINEHSNRQIRRSEARC